MTPLTDDQMIKITDFSGFENVWKHLGIHFLTFESRKVTYFTIKDLPGNEVFIKMIQFYHVTQVWNIVQNTSGCIWDT